jgi:hypothetical protein
MAHARAAAEAYVHAFARRDAAAMCAHMTSDLQRQFIGAAERAAGTILGKTCPQVMGVALRGVGDDQAASFAQATISNVRVRHGAGTFTYQLGDLQVLGKVSRGGDGVWRVSCCVRSG